MSKNVIIQSGFQAALNNWSAITSEVEAACFRGGAIDISHSTYTNKHQALAKDLADVIETLQKMGTRYRGGGGGGGDEQSVDSLDSVSYEPDDTALTDALNKISLSGVKTVQGRRPLVEGPVRRVLRGPHAMVHPLIEEQMQEYWRQAKMADLSCKNRSSLRKMFIEVGGGLNNVPGVQGEGAEEAEEWSDSDSEDEELQRGGIAAQELQRGTGYFVGERSHDRNLPEKVTTETILQMVMEVEQAVKADGGDEHTAALARAEVKERLLVVEYPGRRKAAARMFDGTPHGVALSAQGLLTARALRRAGSSSVAIADQLVVAAGERSTYPFMSEGLQLAVHGDPFANKTFIVDLGDNAPTLPSSNTRTSGSGSGSGSGAAHAHTHYVHTCLYVYLTCSRPPSPAHHPCGSSPLARSQATCYGVGVGQNISRCASEP